MEINYQTPVLLIVWGFFFVSILNMTVREMNKSTLNISGTCVFVQLQKMF